MRVPIVKLSMVREKTVEYEVKVSEAEMAAAIIRSLTSGDADEGFYVLALDARNRINHAYMVAKGGGESVSFNLRDAFRTAVLSNASAIIVAHNHPSGDVTPSNEDRVLTNRIKDGCALLGIRFLDSLVVTADSFRRIE